MPSESESSSESTSSEVANRLALNQVGKGFDFRLPRGSSSDWATAVLCAANNRRKSHMMASKNAAARPGAALGMGPGSPSHGNTNPNNNNNNNNSDDATRASEMVVEQASDLLDGKPPAAQNRVLASNRNNKTKNNGNRPPLFAVNDLVPQNRLVLKGSDRLEARAAQMPVYSAREIAQHNSAKSAWLAIAGYVFDVTDFIEEHPGGLVILKYAGMPDSTDVFRSMHSRREDARLHKYLIGRVAASSATVPNACTRDFRELEREVFAEGLLESNMNYFYSKMMICACIFAASWHFLTKYDHTAYHVLSALLLALFWQQCGFMFHDFLHSAVSHKRWTDRRLGYFFCNIGLGVTSAWWKHDHDRHHAYTNLTYEDPQMTLIPLFATDESELKSFPVDGFFRWMLKTQHILWAPINITLGQLQLHRLSCFHALRTGEYIEILGVALYGLWMCALLHVVPAHFRLGYLMVAYCAVGILHIQLFVSHMDVPKFSQEKQDQLQWVQNQLLTTRNIDCNMFNEWFYGGLHYQIEHHLFPRMPRHNFSTVAPRLRELCRKHRITYLSNGFFPTVFDVVRSLKRVADSVDRLCPNEGLPDIHAKVEKRSSASAAAASQKVANRRDKRADATASATATKQQAAKPSAMAGWSPPVSMTNAPPPTYDAVLGVILSGWFWAVLAA